LVGLAAAAAVVDIIVVVSVVFVVVYFTGVAAVCGCKTSSGCGCIVCSEGLWQLLLQQVQQGPVGVVADVGVASCCCCGQALLLLLLLLLWLLRVRVRVHAAEAAVVHWGSCNTRELHSGACQVRRTLQAAQQGTQQPQMKHTCSW
jgi:hypothetical protein